MFARVSFKPSPTIAAAAQGVATALGGLTQAFEQGAAALGSLGLPGSDPGDLLERLTQAREAATQAVAAPVKFLAITPFQHGIGTRKGENAFLTSEAALKTLSASLAAAAVEDHGTSELALLALVLAAQTQAALAQALDAFNKVYPIAQLEQACRRAKALATLETDKFIIPAGPGFPAWGTVSPQKDRKGQAVAKALGGMLAAGEGSARGAAAPADMLAAFAKKQAAKVAQKAAALADLADSMSGGFDGWAGFYIQAAGPAIFRQLSRLEPPFDASFKCTALLCWFGKPAQLAFYKESFGL